MPIPAWRYRSSKAWWRQCVWQRQRWSVSAPCPSTAVGVLNVFEEPYFMCAALHALSDTNRLLMCVGVVAETFYHLMIITPSPVSTHPSKLFRFFVFFVWEPLTSMCLAKTSLFIRLLYLFCRPSLHLFSPWGYMCTVSSSKHIHPVTYRSAWVELFGMGV